MYVMDSLDRKILYELDLNSRQTLIQLSKKLRVNRATINFRINKLKGNGVIRNFVSLIRPSSLGVSAFKIYLQLQNMKKEDEEKLEEYIKTLPTHWSAKVNGHWDFIIGIITENIQNFNKIKMGVYDKFKGHIAKKSISPSLEIIHYDRSYLINKKEHEKVYFWAGKNKKEDFSDKELKILKLLSLNSRMSCIEIAKQTSLDIKTVASKIKDFQKRGIIYLYNISLNLDKFNYNYFKCLVSFRTFNEDDKKKLINYCKTRPNIINILECIGEWDVELDFELPNINELYEELRNLRDKLSDILDNIEILLLEKEFGYTTIPESIKY